MTQITNQSGLTLGTNLKLHISSAQGTDIAFTGASGSSVTLTTSTTDWTAASDVGGIVQKAFAVGEQVQISGGDVAANEDTGEITAVSANSMTVLLDTNAPSNVAAGPLINVQRRSKFVQFLDVDGLSFVDGVQGSALHSKLVTLWDATDLDRYDPPTGSVEPRAKAMRLLNGFDLFDQDTVSSIRGSAFQVQDTVASSPRKIYALVKAPELVGVSSIWHYWSNSDAELDAPNDAVTLRSMNELVLILDTENSIDLRGNWSFRSEDPGKKIAMQVHNLQYAEIYTVTVTNSIDPKLAYGSGDPLVSDVTIGAGGIYAGVTILEDVDSSISRNVDGGPYDFTREITMDGRGTEIVHAKIDYLLRQPVNVNADGTGPVRRGDKQFPITSFVGEDFTIDGFGANHAPANQNNLYFLDSSGTARNYNTIAAFILLLAQAWASATQTATVTIWVASTHGGTASEAVVFENASSVAQQDIPLSATETSISHAFSTYSGGGHTPGAPLDILVSYNQPNVAEPDLFGPFTIQANTTQAFQLSPRQDPSYVPAA